MAPIPKGGTVAVTGAAGFIGGWIVRTLLDRGYRVRACVRDPDEDEKTGFLKAMGAYASGRLTLHACDLEREGAFDEVFVGCNGVVHTGAQLGRKNPQEHRAAQYVDTAAHMVDSINKSGTVSRLIYTSSIAAVISELDVQELINRPVLYEDRYPDETNLARFKNLEVTGYSVGKVASERLFAEAAEAAGTWDLITCNPSDNVGPIQSKHHKESGPWQHNIETMLWRTESHPNGYEQNAGYRPWMVVDVRDDAACHVGLLESVSVQNGERYIAWSTDTPKVEEIAGLVSSLLPEAGIQVGPLDPTIGNPTLGGAPDPTKETEMRGIWARCDLRNDRIIAATGVTFRPLEESVRDCVESLMSIGGVEPERTDEWKAAHKARL